jgi:predicted dehydrogenase
MADLRFAAFGAGFWAPFQLAGWMELGGVKCVAIYNRTLSKAEEVARHFGIPAVYSDPEELLRRESLDFVDIITAPWTHSWLVRLAAKYQRAVICQKPMAMSYPEANEMVQTCQKAGVPFFIHENWRWQKPVRELKKILDEGTIGTPFRARISQISAFPVFSFEPNLKEWEQYILADMGSHLLDTARFLFGEASLLCCQTHRVHPDIKGEDVATVMMLMGKQTTVTIEIGYAETPIELDVFPNTLIFVEGDKGTAEIGKDYWIRVTNKTGTYARRCLPPRYRWSDPEYLPFHASIVPCNQNLLGALRGEGQAETIGEDNLKTVELVFAAYESAASCKTVRMGGWTERPA